MKIQGIPAEIPSYEITIIGENGQPVAETTEGYAGLAHGETYKIQFKNDSPERIVAATEIDGKNVGNFVIPARQTVTIDRPVQLAQLFTFLADGTKEARQAELKDIPAEKRGLVSVAVTPEKKRKYDDFNYRNLLGGGDDMYRSKGFSFGAETPMRGASRDLGSGGTGLSGHSDQRFTSVHVDLDEARSVTLNLRLAHDRARSAKPVIQPLPGGDDKPQPGKSTPVPPPLKPKR